MTQPPTLPAGIDAGTDTAPPRCPGSPACPAAGSWGATGILPDGHHWHFLVNDVNRIVGGYLAHGPASPEDRARYRSHVVDEYDRAVADAAAHRDERLAAAGLE